MRNSRVENARGVRFCDGRSNEDGRSDRERGRERRSESERRMSEREREGGREGPSLRQKERRRDRLYAPFRSTGPVFVQVPQSDTRRPYSRNTSRVGICFLQGPGLVLVVIPSDEPVRALPARPSTPRASRENSIVIFQGL